MNACGEGESELEKRISLLIQNEIEAKLQPADYIREYSRLQEDVGKRWRDWKADRKAEERAEDEGKADGRVGPQAENQPEAAEEAEEQGE